MRRYDIDWLRVIALGLLIIYHTAIVFQPWGEFIRFPQSSEPWEGLWLVMSVMNPWRIPLLFFVAGMGAWFSIQRRGAGGMLAERSLRILLPLVFCSFTIVPLYYGTYQYFHEMPFEYEAHPSHLWFLVNIFVYTLLLSPLMFYFKRKRDAFTLKMGKKLLEHPAGLYALQIPFIIEAVWTSPAVFPLFVATPHGFWYGLLAFLFGCTLAAIGEPFRAAVIRMRFISLGTGFACYVLRFCIFELEAPSALMMFESLNWIFGAFGFAALYLNQPSRALAYLTKATYPVYIFHMLAMLLSSKFILAMPVPLPIQFVLLTLGTYLLALAAYELTRRIPIIRTLFGMPWRSSRQAQPEGLN